MKPTSRRSRRTSSRIRRMVEVSLIEELELIEKRNNIRLEVRLTSSRIRRMVEVSLIEDLELIEERNNIRLEVR
jgi:hypothetical protein